MASVTESEVEDIELFGYVADENPTFKVKVETGINFREIAVWITGYIVWLAAEAVRKLLRF